MLHTLHRITIINTTHLVNEIDNGWITVHALYEYFGGEVLWMLNMFREFMNLEVHRKTYIQHSHLLSFNLG